MSILSGFKDFGRSVVSGIGNVFHSSPSPTAFNAPNSTVFGPPQQSPISQSISDSVFSTIARWISPDDQPVQTTAANPQVVFVPQGGAVTTGSKIFGIPQVTLLVVLGGVAAFLILKRN